MFCDGKARQPVEGIIGAEFNGQFPCIPELSLTIFAANHLPLSMLGSSVWWFPLFKQSLTRFRRSSRFPFNFKPLHFSHRLNCSTVYSSGSRSNLDPGTPSSSVKTVKHYCALLAIRIHFLYFSYRIGLCLSESQRGSEIRDVISAKRYFKSASHFALVRFWNYSRNYSLNCTPLGPITITFRFTLKRIWQGITIVWYFPKQNSLYK